MSTRFSRRRLVVTLLVAAGAGFLALPAEAGKQRFADIVDSAARRHGVDPDLVHAVIAVESGYRANAQSPAGAQGLMQLMPGTQLDFGVSDAFDPRQNVDAGVAYLRRLTDEFGTLLGVAAYNAGPGAVRRYNGIPPYEETRAYVRSVLDRGRPAAGGPVVEEHDESGDRAHAAPEAAARASRGRRVGHGRAGAAIAREADVREDPGGGGNERAYGATVAERRVARDGRNRSERPPMPVDRSHEHVDPGQFRWRRTGEPHLAAAVAADAVAPEPAAYPVVPLAAVAIDEIGVRGAFAEVVAAGAFAGGRGFSSWSPGRAGTSACRPPPATIPVTPDGPRYGHTAIPDVHGDVEGGGLPVAACVPSG